MDSSTNQPLPDVTITFDNKTYKTDKSGHYSIEYATGFCPDRHFTFEKDGFKKFQLRIERSGKEVSYHVTDKSEFIKYDQPMYLDSAKRSFTIGEWIELNSTNFGVRNDTLIIYLDK